MADRFTIDTSQVDRLAARLGSIPARAIPAVDGVLKKAAVNIKTEMIDVFERSPHFKRVARSVTFTRTGFARSMGYEIGPDRGRNPAGALAGIAVEGGANGGGGTVEIDGLLAAETPAIDRELGKVLGGLL